MRCFFHSLVTHPFIFSPKTPCVLDSGSHTPPEDRGACSPGAGCGYIRRRRNSRAPQMRCFFHSLVTHPFIFPLKTPCVLDSGSHTPPEDRQARLSGAGCGYIRRRRNSRIPSNFNCHGTSQDVLFCLLDIS